MSASPCISSKIAIWPEHCSIPLVSTGDQDERDWPEGRYSNYFKVGHNDMEFVLDFGQYYEGSALRIVTRIVTTPSHAKALLALLSESIDRFEGGSVEQ